MKQTLTSDPKTWPAKYIRFSSRQNDRPFMRDAQQLGWRRSQWPGKPTRRTRGNIPFSTIRRCVKCKHTILLSKWIAEKHRFSSLLYAKR